MTLHLRGPDGIYAGPVVVGRDTRRRRAVLGVRAGARLGAIRIRRGYATLARTLRRRWLDRGVTARARRGVPIGAGRFGRVRSARARAGPGDSDLDGIPDVLDVDDDGDLILDELDRATSRARTSQDSEERFALHSRLTLELSSTANANATPLTPELMDRALATGGDLLFTILPGDSLADSPELDCGGSIQQPPRPEGLVYCRPHAAGGTGQVGIGGGGPLRPFPDCCDPDEDGLGTLTADTGPLGTPLTAMTLRHGATTAQIGTGDFMMQRVTRGGVETAFLAALQYVFASVPALASFDDGQGNAVMVSYPVPGPDPVTGACPPPGPPCAAPGSRDNGFLVNAGADGDVVLRVAFWRPQRKAVPEWGETGDWIDMGGLRYEVQVEESGRRCPQEAFSENNPELALHSSSPIYADFTPGFSDLAGDRPASPANKLTYTLNLTRCLEANGFSFNPGDDRTFSFLAVNPSGPDNGQQSVWFRRQ